ncbi:MAG: spore protease YyaC [Bacillus sp. (in: firmicutes)]
MVRKPNIFCNEQQNQILFEDVDARANLSLQLLSQLSSRSIKTVVVACIGTDRSTGDSLGPLVGTLLSEKKHSPFHVYGTLDHPIHAVNLHEKIKEINENHKDAFIIAVDACLGRIKSVGMVQINPGPLKPGAGVNKDLPEIGDIHITGIVNVSGFMEFFVLQNTRLNLVMKMAKVIADSIDEAGHSFLHATPRTNINWGLEQEEAN